MSVLASVTFVLHKRQLCDFVLHKMLFFRV